MTDDEMQRLVFPASFVDDEQARENELEAERERRARYTVKPTRPFSPRTEFSEGQPPQ